MAEQTGHPEVEDLEIELLLEAVFRYYYLDFREFSFTHIKRRVKFHMEKYKYSNVPELLHDILLKHEAFEDLLKHFSINVSDMFRDPSFYKSVTENVFPVLHTYPFIKIWHAGCSSGEEVYSIEIFLEENGLMGKSQIYATDFNETIINAAREGIYPLSKAAGFEKNYREAGGKNKLSEYYHAAYDYFQIDKKLRESVLFGKHNLVSDKSFLDMNMIVCRNVFIYFKRNLQEKVLKLLYDSLIPGGFLCLGLRESLTGLRLEPYFELTDKENRIYRKKYAN